jgi:type IV pilus assembly protein PilM
MATRQPGAWGIDIGQSALKALRFENKDGVAVATAFDYVEHPKILSQPDADPDLLTREALEKFLSRNNLRGDKVSISVSGQAGLARFVKLPPVEEKKIGEIVKFEAKQQIPFPLEEVVWDYQKIGSGVVTDGFAMETEIGLFAIKRENVSRTLQHFQDVNIEVDIVQMAPLALCSFVGYDLLGKDANSTDEAKGKRECVVALDVGVDSASLVITDGSRIIWQRPIGIGGNAFTRALTKDLKLTYAKAEHLKKNATKSPDLKRILLALRPDLNKFVEEVQKSLQFFSSTHRDAHIKYMVGMGGAFRLPGLQKYLQEKLQLDVRKLTKFVRLQGDSVTTAPVFNDNVMSMGVVYGLALQGLSMARLRTNLLPQEIRMDRLVRSKKPWAVAAAACLLLGVGGLAYGTKMEHDAVDAPEIRAVIEKDGKHALDEGKRHNKDFQDENDRVENLKKSILTIVAGQNERLNWIKLNQFVDDCLPRPDGKNLTEKQKADFWNKGGEVAWNQWIATQQAAKNDAPVNTTSGLDDLMQINLESVNALFTDDLAAYFGRLQGAIKELDGMPADDKTKAPNGPGWIVELRGYTFHQGQRDFVVDTLLANIAAKGAKAEAAPKPGEPGDPIGGKVSHPVLYRYKPVENHQPGKFELIENSDMFLLVQGGIPGKAGDRAPGGAAGMLGGGKRDGWKPLGANAATLKPRDADQPARPLDASAGRAEVKKGQYVRTEFIILFIWREPTWDVVASAVSSGSGAGANAGAGAGKAGAGKAGQGK